MNENVETQMLCVQSAFTSCALSRSEKAQRLRNIRSTDQKRMPLTVSRLMD